MVRQFICKCTYTFQLVFWHISEQISSDVCCGLSEIVFVYAVITQIKRFLLKGFEDCVALDRGERLCSLLKGVNLKSSLVFFPDLTGHL